MTYTIEDLKKVYPQALLTAKILNKERDVKNILSFVSFAYIGDHAEAYKIFKLFLTDLQRYTFNSIIDKYDITLIKEFKI